MPVLQKAALILADKTRQVQGQTAVTGLDGQTDPFPGKAFRYAIIFHQPGENRVTLIRLRFAHSPELLGFAQHTIGLLQNDLTPDPLTPEYGVADTLGMRHQVCPTFVFCQ